VFFSEFKNKEQKWIFSIIQMFKLKWVSVVTLFTSFQKRFDDTLVFKKLHYDGQQFLKEQKTNLGCKKHKDMRKLKVKALMQIVSNVKRLFLLKSEKLSAKVVITEVLVSLKIFANGKEAS